MVTSLGFQRERPRVDAGFTLVELMFSIGIFAAVTAALMIGFISLKRNYAATMDFAVNHADQMRISDYLAMDFRRALTVDPPLRNDVTVYIPSYYDDTAARNPQTPSLNGNGGVYYGAAGSSVKVHYYLSGGVIYRQEGTATPLALAVDVQDFEVDTTDLGKVITTRITFKPTFRSSGVTTEIASATAFHNTTLLRNNRGVY
jgi:prepilin-type N-terminal cleavage/methylation domain-containing protein